VAPALAAGGPPNGNSTYGKGGGGGAGKGGNMPFALAGVISALDPATHTVTVTVACGNTLVKPYISQNLSLHLTDVTRFLLRNPDGVATPISFADLAVGQSVSANGQIVNNFWTASRITVGAELTCLP
jgi:hypothetical protein